jgi:predicted DCC family thiol-disulfide oxidoreductase YuxK
LFDRLYLFIAKHRYRMPRWLSPYTLIHKPCRNGTCRLP